jgi:hypothetical protein
MMLTGEPMVVGLAALEGVVQDSSLRLLELEEGSGSRGRIGVNRRCEKRATKQVRSWRLRTLRWGLMVISVGMLRMVEIGKKVMRSRWEVTAPDVQKRVIKAWRVSRRYIV